MKNLQKVIHCREGRRCNLPLSCPTCGENRRKKNFKEFAQGLDTFLNTESQTNTPLTYIVISLSGFSSLRNKLNKIINFTDEVRELKKRNKLPVFYSRIEVSFKAPTKFHPHVNLLVWGDHSPFKQLCKKLKLNYWSRKKNNNRKTALSIAWYMLKFNNIDTERGEAVRIALNKKRPLLHSKEFNVKKNSYIDEIIDMEFVLWEYYPIRSKEEIKLREERREKIRQINQEYNPKIKRAKEAFLN